MGRYTMLNKQKRAIQQTVDIYRIARISKLTSSEINRRFIDNVLNDTLLKATGYVREYVRGYRDCLDNQLGQEMEFCYLVDGKLYTTAHDTDKPRWDTLPREEWDLSNVPCAFFWRNTDKPFTDLKPIKGE